MKTRRGFVSNSSSSSFVIVIKEEAFQLALQNKADWEREILDQMLPPDVCFGIQCRVGSKLNNAGGYSSWEELNIEFNSKYKEVNGFDDDADYGDVNDTGMKYDEEAFYHCYSSFFESIPEEDKFTHSADW